MSPTQENTSPGCNTASIENAGSNSRETSADRSEPERSRSVRFDLKETIIPDSRTHVVYPKEGPLGDAPTKNNPEQEGNDKRR